MSFNDLSIRTKLLINNSLPLTLFIALGVVLFSSIVELQNSSKIVEHTHKVIDGTNGIMNSMVDQETGVRGYAVGGEDAFLEPYYNGFNNYSTFYKMTKELTQDNSFQQENLEKIKVLVSKWQTYAKSLIDLRKNVKEGESIRLSLDTLLASGIGKQYMDSIRLELKSIPSIELQNTILINMINMETGLRGFHLYRDSNYLEPYLSGKTEIKNVAFEVEGTDLAKKIDTWMNSYAEKSISITNEIKKYKSIEDVYLAFDKKEGKEYMDSIRNIITSMIDEEKSLMVIRKDASESASNQAVGLSIFGYIIVSIIAFSVSLFISNKIALPIKNALRISKDVSRGQLSIKPQKTGKDEAGKLLEAVQSIATEMKTIISKLSATSISLTNTSGDINVITTSSKKDSNEQLQIAGQLTTSMEQMLIAIQDVCESASTAADLANEAQSETDEGKTTITRSISSINKLEEEISLTSHKLEGLAKQASNIDSILDVIRDISDQTNLLALNAAIEAARAGEQGRGFAVVADEVRTLAKRTQGSTEEIQSLIENLQKEANGAVTTMQSSQATVKTSVQEVSQSVEMFNTISDKIYSINNMNTKIATTTEEQTATAIEINKTIAQAHMITKESLNKIDTTVKTSEELSTIVFDINNIIKFFKL